MSSLFTQISQLNQEAQQQRSSVAGGKTAADETPEPNNATLSSDSSAPATIPAPVPSSSSSSSSSAAVTRDTSTQSSKKQEVMAPTSGTVVPHTGTAEDETTKRSRSAGKTSKAVRSSEGKENLGKGSRLDLDKLKTVIEELSVVQANSNGLNVRMSEREHQDIEDFILDTLRKHGLKGQQVSIAKLMRYAMRYMFRVHPQEFVTALRAALEVEETLSI